MLKQGLKNYFYSFKHFFTPLGTMFLGLLIGLSIFIPGTISAINTLIDGVKALIDGINLDLETLWEQLRTAITSLDWNDPVTALKTMLSSEWINAVLSQSLSSILGSDFSVFAEAIKTLIDAFVSTMGALVFLWIFFFIIGFIAGFMLTRFFIRRSIAKRSLWKWILTSVVNAIMTAGIMAAIYALYSVWKPSAIFSSILLFILPCAFSLTSAYLVYAYKKVKFTKVLNIKNMGYYLLSSLLILVFSAIFTLLAVLINALMGVFVGLAIFEIAICVMGMNADSYVQGLIKTADADSISIGEQRPAPDGDE